jgi:SAM-dependent methyltransferase
VSFGRRLRSLFVFTPPDPLGFWSGRASCPGSLSAMWRNETYNSMAEADQWAAIVRNLPTRRGAVLDLGCGTGRMSSRLAERFDRYVGVDLEPMVEEAASRNPLLAESYVAATAQGYDYPPDTFDLCLSMACLASACTAEELPQVLERMLRSLRPGGILILIDPFHRLPPLVRTCRLSPGEVVELLRAQGARLVEWSGVHFVPTRVLLAGRAGWSRRLTRAGYSIGEGVCRLAPRRLADYSVIAFAVGDRGATGQPES